MVEQEVVEVEMMTMMMVMSMMMMLPMTSTTSPMRHRRMGARISRATRTEGRHQAAPRALRRPWTRGGPGQGGTKRFVAAAAVAAIAQRKTETETN
jgi:hypothetical protein